MILASSRTLKADVGGNSRYLREVAAGLQQEDVALRFLGPGRGSAACTAGLPTDCRQGLKRGRSKLTFGPVYRSALCRTVSVSPVSL